MNTEIITHDLKKDDILVGDIGYSMLMPTFYKIMSITPKSVRIMPMTQSRQSQGHNQGIALPSEIDANDKSKTTRVRKGWKGQSVATGTRGENIYPWSGQGAHYDFND